MTYGYKKDVTFLTSIVDSYLLPAIKSIIDERLKEFSSKLDLTLKEIEKIKSDIDILKIPTIKYFANKLEEKK
jgi:hypothetical protein